MCVLAGGIFLLLGLVAPARVNAGTAINDSVLLDPFSPVPEIQFSPGYGGCGDGCYHGYRHCWHDCGYAGGCDHDCRYGGWGCERDCRDGWRPALWHDCDRDCHFGEWNCERGCRLSYGPPYRYGYGPPPPPRYPDAPPVTIQERVERNDFQADRNDFMTERWKAQSDWYQHNVIDRDCWLACDGDAGCERDCHYP
jgi:hypothetical protein